MSRLSTAEIFVRSAAPLEGVTSDPQIASSVGDSYEAHEIIDKHDIRKYDFKNNRETCCRSANKNPICCGTSLRCKQIILVVTFLVIVPLLVFFAFAIVPIKYRPQPIKPLSNGPATTSGLIKVLLLGDSVVGIPSRKSGLIPKIAALLPQYSMDIAVSGKLGVRMFVLRSRLERILKAEVPDVVILYSDSDLSNQNEDPLSIQEKFVLREHYRANFTLIVEAILATNAKLALSGPGLLGEGPFFQVPNPARFVNKNGMLDDYCKIDRSVATKYRVPYLDVRGHLKRAVPWWRLWYAGYVTKDGEHTNERGTLLLAEVFSKQLLQWFQAYNSTTSFKTPVVTTTPSLKYELDDATI